MNDFNRESNLRSTLGEIPCDLLDRLAAGELDEPSRRKLLAWCERHPDGWKRCALAFLEAQTWEHAFALPSESEVVEVQPTAGKRTANGHASVYRGPEWALRAGPAQASLSKHEKIATRWRVSPATLAALLLAGIALGAVVGRVSNARWGSQPIATPDRETKSERSSSGKAPSQDPHEPSRETPPDGAPSDRRLAAPESLVATVSLGGRPGEAAPELTMQLPLADMGSSTASTPPPSVPEHVSRRLARLGWRVEPERKYLPAKLPDGSPVLVPIDRMRMKYEGRAVY